MSILNLPVISRTASSHVTFSLIPNTMAFESPLNKAVQTSELPGARWRASFGWQNLNGADARMVKAWINSLSGRAGRFYLYDFSHPTPSGSASGAPLVKGAGQSGRTLITDGWTANQSNLLLPGDYFSVGSQLLVITAAASSSASGEATLTFEAPLRSSPADNTAIVINKPCCIMMLADDEQDNFPYDEPGRTSVSFNCMEVFG